MPSYSFAWEDTLSFCWLQGTSLHQNCTNVLQTTSPFVALDSWTSKFFVMWQCMLLFCDKQIQKTYVLVSTKKTLLLVYATCCLGEARLCSRHVAPLLHNGLLDLPGVPPGPGAHLLGDVDTLLGRLEEGHKLGNMLALALGLEVACLLRNLLENNTCVMEDSNTIIVNLTSCTTVAFSLKQVPTGSVSTLGPQTSVTTGLHSVLGVYLVTRSVDLVHTLLGHLVQTSVVV